MSSARLPFKPCGDPSCEGWDIYETDRGSEIQRCDVCRRYETDEEAMAAAARFVAGTLALVKPARRARIHVARAVIERARDVVEVIARVLQREAES